MPKQMSSWPTAAQKRKAASLTRLIDMRFRFIVRLADGCAVYEGRVDEELASIIAIDSKGKVVRAASRTFPEYDEKAPFALIEPIGKHGAGRVPEGFPQFADEALARLYVIGRENAAGSGRAS